ncbi:FecR domain-containing protein [Spirochaetota bacterium]
MKKTLFSAIIISIIFTFNSCKKEEVKPRRGIVNFMAGKVFIISKAGKLTAKVGDIVSGGMKIETGKKSFVDIYFGQNVIKILENSSIEIIKLIKNLKTDGKNTEIFIKNGGIFSKLPKKLLKYDNFKISTPTTVAAVRGTNFLVIEKKGKGKVSCLNGEVSVRDSAKPEIKPVSVKSGEEVEVQKGKDLIVKKLSPDSRQSMEDILNNIQDLKDDIRRKFEEDREKIRKTVIDQKESNREIIEKQKIKDKENVDKQKSRDRENIEKVKVDVNKDKVMQKENIEDAKRKSKEAMDSVKPKIKKFDPKIK